MFSNSSQIIQSEYATGVFVFSTCRLWQHCVFIVIAAKWICVDRPVESVCSSTEKPPVCLHPGGRTPVWDCTGHYHPRGRGLTGRITPRWGHTILKPMASNKLTILAWTPFSPFLQHPPPLAPWHPAWMPAEMSPHTQALHLGLPSEWL